MTHNQVNNLRNRRILVAACITFAFVCAVSLLLVGNGLKSAAQCAATASLLLFVPLCYTAFKCLSALTGTRRVGRIAAVYSLCLCVITTIATGYMANTTLVLNPATIASALLAAPLITVYIARFFVFFDSKSSQTLRNSSSANPSSANSLSASCLKTSCSSAHAEKSTSCSNAHVKKCTISRFAQTWRRFLTWCRVHPKLAFLVAWLAMFILWLPYLFAFWPSVWAFDTHSQTYWILEGTFFIDAWHPPLHTLWISLPVAASKALCGSYVPGVAFYTLTQMLVLSALFTGIVRIIARWKIPQVLPLIFWFVFALFPVFPFWSVVATKDVIFSGLFALSCACLVDLTVQKAPRLQSQTQSQTQDQTQSQTRDQAQAQTQSQTQDQTQSRTQSQAQAQAQSKTHSALHFILLWLLLMLTAMFRNNAIYGFALFAVLLLVFGGKLSMGRFKPAAFMGSAVLAWVIITGPVYGALGVAPIQSKEMMSVPAQQLATVAQQGENVTEEELSFIEKYVPDHAKLKEKIADPVKNNFNSKEMTEDPLGFAAGYLKIGFAHPVAYTNAFFRLELAFLSPFGGNVKSAESTAAYVENRTKWNAPAIIINEPSLAPALKGALTTFLKGDAVSCVPLVSTFWQGGFWLWVVFLLLALCRYLRKQKIAFIAAFILCYWATVCVGPVAIFRYALPLVCCAPLLIALFFCLNISQNTTALKPTNPKKN